MARRLSPPPGRKGCASARRRTPCSAPAIQEARALIDAGAIGKPLTGLAAVMSHGMEHWHPNPGFFFRAGAGPVFDMGPYYLSALVTLLGPVASVQATGQIGFDERIVTTAGSPAQGQSIKVETLTNVHALLDFASGAHVTFLASWDVWKHGVPPIELHGAKSVAPAARPQLVRRRSSDRRAKRRVADDPHRRQDLRRQRTGRRRSRNSPTTVAWASPTWRARSSTRRPHRANGDVALHVLAVMAGILEAATAGRRVAISPDLRAAGAARRSRRKDAVEAGDPGRGSTELTPSPPLGE